MKTQPSQPVRSASLDMESLLRALDSADEYAAQDAQKRLITTTKGAAESLLPLFREEVENQRQRRNRANVQALLLVLPASLVWTFLTGNPLPCFVAFVGWIVWVGSFSGSSRLERRLVSALSLSEDLRLLGLLLELRVRYPEADVAIQKMLPQVSPETRDLLTGEQRRRLYDMVDEFSRLLAKSSRSELLRERAGGCDRVLHAMEQIAEPMAFWRVKRLAEVLDSPQFREFSALRIRAQRLWKVLAERGDVALMERDLLRPSSVDSHSPRELLHTVTDSQESEAHLLLRPRGKE